MGRLDTEEVAEEDVVEVQLAGRLGVEHQAEGEETGENHAHNGVLFYPGVAFDPAGRGGAEQAAGEGSDRQGKTDGIGYDDTGEHGVRDRVTHQGPAPQHEKTGKHRAYGGDQCAHGEGLQHEAEVEGLEK